MLSSSKCHVGIFRLTLRNISSHSIVCLHAHLWLHTNHFHLRITFPWLGNERKMGSVYFTWEGKTVSAQFMNAVLVAISRSNWSFYFRNWAMFAITFRLFSMFSLKHLNAGQTLKNSIILHLFNKKSVRLIVCMHVLAWICLSVLLIIENLVSMSKDKGSMPIFGIWKE